MPELDTIQVQNRIKRLPESVWDRMNSPETAEIIGNIAKDANLSEKEVGLLADEVGLVFLGVTPIQGFRESLQKRLEISKETADLIAQETEQEIFASIRGEIDRIYKEFGQQNKSENVEPIDKLDESRDIEQQAVTSPKNEKPFRMETAQPQHSIDQDPYREPVEEKDAKEMGEDKPQPLHASSPEELAGQTLQAEQGGGSSERLGPFVRTAPTVPDNLPGVQNKKADIMLGNQETADHQQQPETQPTKEGGALAQKPARSLDEELLGQARQASERRDESDDQTTNKKGAHNDPYREPIE